MLNKRAIELSMNFLVVLIISIVIFGFGVRFISTLFSQAKELEDYTFADLEEKIGNINCEGSERVCIGNDRKTIPRKEVGVFGMKMWNILDSQNFDVTISRPTPSGVSSSGLIQSDSLKWKPHQRSIFIQKNAAEQLAIGIEVPPNVVPGTYIFNVEIKTQDAKAYSSVQKFYVVVP